MVSRRTWSREAFERIFVGPSAHGFAEDVLFQQLDDDAARREFRISAGEVLGLRDELHELSAAPVTLVHPLDLSPASVLAWSEVFADHEIVQPFPQLLRGVFELSEEEAAKGRIDRLQKMRVSPERFDEFARGGWYLRFVGSNGALSGAEHVLAPGAILALPVRQKGKWIFLGRAFVQHEGTTQESFEGIDPRVISEALRGIEALRESAEPRP